MTRKETQVFGSHQVFKAATATVGAAGAAGGAAAVTAGVEVEL